MLSKLLHVVACTIVIDSPCGKSCSGKPSCTSSIQTAFWPQSKADLAAIRKQRKAQRQAANAQGTAPQPLPQGNGSTGKPTPTTPTPQADALKPSCSVEVNDKSAGAGTSKAQPSILAAVETPSNQPPKAQVHGAATSAPLPKGFFDDKKSDALAHGERLRTAKDDAHDMEVFQREVEQLEEKRVGLEAEEAELAAERAAALEEFESGQKRDQLESLKKRQRIGVSDERTVELVQTALKAKALEVAPAAHAVSEDLGSDSDSDDDPLNTVKSDWRSKR
eukprot:jgi/Ulvmu1/4590/UM002_0319.1